MQSGREDTLEERCAIKFWRGPQEYVAYEFVLTSLSVSRMSGSSNLDSFRDRW